MNIYRPSVRKRKAYWTAFLIITSYLWFGLKSKLFGQSYSNRNIGKLHQKNAIRVRDRALELQGLFIKIGQMISILSNMLPDEFSSILASLQDNTPADDFETVENLIQTSLGKSTAELFDNFEKEPIASASIGQVHKAQLNGESVVVKVQHANIQAIAKADLVILKNLVRLGEWLHNIKGYQYLYEQVKQMIEEELDYNKETASIQRIQTNLKDSTLQVIVPKVYPTYQSEKVLVMEYCEGVNIGNIEQLKAWDIDLEQLNERLIKLFCQMIFVDGFYHADPHPGNILVNKKGELVLLDYGAVAALHPNTKIAMPELIEAVVKDDTEGTINALKKMGFVGKDKAAEQAAANIIKIFREFLEEEIQLDGLNFKDIQLNSGLGSIAKLLARIDLKSLFKTLQIPKDWVLLNRTIMLLIGISYQLSPTSNPLEVIRPYFKEHIFDKNTSLQKLILNTLKTQLTTAISIPQELHRFLKKSNKGDMIYEIQGLENGFQLLYKLGQQFIYAALMIVCLYFVNFMDVEGNVVYLFWGLSGVFFVLLLKK